jgi:hypothetical protein
MSLPREQAWFPAKRYGYGWGLPRRWQGWVVMLTYVAALIVPRFYAGEHVGFFIAHAFVATALLIALCIWKGETPKWRWGSD